MIGRLFAIALALVGAGCLSQFPEFAQQYGQRLGGRLDELRTFVEEFDRDAAAAGKTRTDALATFETSSEPFLVERGRDAGETIERYERYRQIQARLQGAAPFERLWVFATTYQPEIADATFDDYEPAMPLTVEGAAHTGAGLVAGFALAFFGIRGARAAGNGAIKLAGRSARRKSRAG